MSGNSTRRRSCEGLVDGCKIVSKPLPFSGNFCGSFGHDFAVVNFDFNRQITHGAKLRLKTNGDKRRVHNSSGTTSH
jgi:hypothetical protein